MKHQSNAARTPSRIVRISSLRFGSLLLLAGVFNGIGIMGTVHAQTLPQDPTVRSGTVSVVQDNLSIMTVSNHVVGMLASQHKADFEIQLRYFFTAGKKDDE